MANRTIKTKWVSAYKLASLFAIFGVLNGFFIGIISFIFIQLSIESLKMDVGVGGSILLCFVLVPAGVTFVFYCLGLFFGVVLNLGLRLTRGLDLMIEENEISQT